MFSVIFAIAWITISYFKLEAFSDFVYNLGINVSALIQISHTTSLKILLTEVDPHWPFYFILAYVFYYIHDVFFLVILQDLAMSLSMIFLYYIMYRFTNSILLSFITVISFSLFFSVQLTLWEAYGDSVEFFPVFLFSGIYCYIQKKNVSIILLTLAAATSIVVSFSILLLFFYIFAGDMIKRILSKHSGITPSRITYLPLMITIGSALPILNFLIQLHLSGLVTFQGRVNTGNNIFGTYATLLLSGLHNNLLVFFLITIPFVPFFFYPNKFYLALLPFYAFYFLGNSYGAYLFDSQYFNGSLFAPLIFVAIGKSLADMSKIKLKSRHSRFGGIFSKNARTKQIFFAFFSLAVIVMVGAFYAPYAVFNSTHVPGGIDLYAYGNFKDSLAVDQEEYIANSFVSLVPFKSTILLQNNMPQFADHYRNYVFGPGNVPWNYSEPIFPSLGPIPVSIIPEYIMTDYASWFYDQFTANSSQGNMNYWLTHFSTSYDYGVLAASGPFYLYKLNYVGTPLITYSENYTVAIDINSHNSTFDTSKISTSEIFLMPGKYLISARILVSAEATSLSLSNLSLKLMSESGGYSSVLNNVGTIREPGYYELTALTTYNYTAIKDAKITFSLV